jgi:putative membrane protein
MTVKTKEETSMGPYDPGRPGFPGAGAGGALVNHHSTWWGVVGHVLPLVLFLVLIAVLIWAVVRITSQRPALAGAGPASMPLRDPAVDELRIRYARGDLSRDDFLQRARDLGADPGPAVADKPDAEDTTPDGG